MVVVPPFPLECSSTLSENGESVVVLAAVVVVVVVSMRRADNPRVGCASIR